MRILFVGDVRPGQTSRMRMEALRRNGHEVLGVDSATPWLSSTWLNRQVSRRTEIGSIVDFINLSTVQAAEQFRPDLVWCEKQEFLRAPTIDRLKRKGSLVAHYTPDPYFWLSWKRTQIMDESMRCFDVIFYCKSYERAQYESLGIPTYFLPLGFCDATHIPYKNGSDKSSMFGFVGGWEPRRQELLASLAEIAELKVWGNYWHLALTRGYGIRKHLILRQLAGREAFDFSGNAQLLKCIEGGEVYGAAYARVLSSATVGVGFLRQVCPDQHTTRSFEIPACGSMLLADRTQEHQELFSEGSEADYFSDETEFLDKCQFYARNPASARRIAEAGRKRALRSGYTYSDRMRSAIDDLQKTFRLPT